MEDDRACDNCKLCKKTYIFDLSSIRAECLHPANPPCLPYLTRGCDRWEPMYEDDPDDGRP